MKRHCWSEKELAFLKKNAKGKPFKDLALMLNEAFSLSLTTKQVKSRSHYYGIKTGSLKTRGLLSPQQIKWLKKNAKGKRFADIAEHFNETSGCDFTARQLQSCCRFRGIKAGTYGQGSRTLPIGTERIWDSRGDVYVKVSNGQGLKSWKLKHYVVWENAHGKIPEGYKVIFLDKNRENFDLENLALLSNNEVLQLGNLGLWFDDREMTKCGLVIVKHNLAIHERLSKELGKDEHRKFRYRIHDQKRRKNKKRR